MTQTWERDLIYYRLVEMREDPPLTARDNTELKQIDNNLRSSSQQFRRYPKC